MQGKQMVSINNFDQYNHIIPYIRYCNEDKYDEPWTLPERRMYDYEFVLVTKGTGEIQIEDRVYSVKPNDLIFFEPNKIHSGRSVLLPFHFLCIHFDIYIPKMTNTLPSNEHPLLESIPSGTTQYEKANITLQEHISLEDDGYIQLLLKRIFHEMKERNPAFQLMIKSLFTELMISLFREQRQIPEARKFSSEVQTIIQYIKEHYMKRIKLQDLSKLTHFQPVYISNLFKKQTGITLSQFIMMYRISVAKELLLGTGRKIEDITQSVGFYDIHQFSNVFKKMEGLSPSQFRKIRRY